MNETETRLRDLLHAAVAQHPVGPAPLAGVVGTRRRRLPRTLLAAVAVLVIVAGSGALVARQRSSEHHPTPASTSTLVFATQPDNTSGEFQAEVSGTLTVDDLGCVVLAQPAGQPAIFVFWPHGYTAALDDEVVVVRGATGQIVARGGDEVHGAGGYFPAGANTPDQQCVGKAGQVATLSGEIRVD
jgi:hypothetical protein